MSLKIRKECEAGFTSHGRQDLNRADRLVEQHLTMGGDFGRKSKYSVFERQATGKSLSGRPDYEVNISK